MRAVHSTGIDPRKTPVAIDIDCSMKFQSYGVQATKTITRTRGGQGGPWLSTHGRRTNVNELLKIQGFYPSEIDWQTAGLSTKAIGELIGNSIPVPMIGHILAKSMYSAGLLAKPIPFPRSCYAKAVHGHLSEIAE